MMNALSGACILSNNDNSDEPIVHIRLRILDYSYDLLLNINEWFLDSFKLKGIEGVTNVTLEPDQRLISYDDDGNCLLYTSPSPRDGSISRMPSSA